MKQRMTITIDFETSDDDFSECCKILEQLREETNDKFIVEYFINDYKSDVEIVSFEEV